ncbi:lysophospholipid acyltransferase family protein [Stenoxybacter acetivorans]|uniref:lysophospholipid acyltransferase family protein n=1 Tax=Stenoxybacter acetivorans TaxID=422441 RepID=UPI000559D29B|nr:lysophospholipid acyltransferase family protein [Stenoxybacter acetivorans]
MTSAQYTPLSFYKRLLRLAKLPAWLARTYRRINTFTDLSVAERNDALAAIANEILAIFDIRLHINRRDNTSITTPILAVSNHISWLDVFVLMSLYPSGFIAKQSIRRWPIIGKLAWRIDTVFINRTSRKDTDSVNQAIAQALLRNRSVTFFPESKTSDGIGILPFKAALFQAAIDTNTPIQTIALRYFDEQQQRTTDASYAHVSLLTSVWRVAGHHYMNTVVDFAPLIDSKPVPALDRFELKDLAERFVESKVCTQK